MGFAANPLRTRMILDGTGPIGTRPRHEVNPTPIVLAAMERSVAARSPVSQAEGLLLKE